MDEDEDKLYCDNCCQFFPAEDFSTDEDVGFYERHDAHWCNSCMDEIYD